MNLRSIIPLLLTLAPAGACMGQDLRATDLVGNSPFLPPDFGQQQQSQGGPAISESDLEYRGMYSLGERFYFNVYNKRENKGRWLTLNDENEGLAVTSFDVQADRISIRVNGRNETLEMATPSSGSLPVELASNSGASRRVLPSRADDDDNRSNPRVVRRTVPSRVVNRSVPPPPPAVLQRSGAGARPVPPPAVRTQGNVGAIPSFGYGPTTGASPGGASSGGAAGAGRSPTTPPPQAPAASPPEMSTPGAPPNFVPQIPDFVKNGFVPPTPPPGGPPTD